MNLFKLRTCISFLFLITAVYSEPVSFDVLGANIEKAYNFDQEAFQWFESEAFDKDDAMQSFVASTASYWVYQADRIESGKRDHTEAMLDRSVSQCKSLYKRNKKDSTARFLYGVSRCNRARFYVEEQQWFRAYMDAREGIDTLKKLVEDDPNYTDAYFALGVAECFLSDAPMILKPLARLMGFKGSATLGIEKLRRCIDAGRWTKVEAEYYLGYYFYNVAEDGARAIEVFEGLSERYPNNPLFAYFLGRSYQISHQPLKALEVYEYSRDVAYRVEADDIGNWSSFRVGTILQGEHRYEDALKEYVELQKHLHAETHHEDYFFLLPLKFGETFMAMGDYKRAKAYFSVIQPDWDRATYDIAQEYLRDID